MTFGRALCCAWALQGPGVSAHDDEAELREGFLMGLEGFDSNGDGTLTREEVAVGILIPSESPVLPELPESYPLGRSLCEDPYPDSVSLNECLIAESREAPTADGLSFPATLEEVLQWYASLCDVPSWHSGECLDTCSACRGGNQEDNGPWEDAPQQQQQRDLLSPRRGGAPSSSSSGGVDILISSDWHIEPWYKYSSTCKSVCRFSKISTSNMWQCEVDGKHPATCKVSGKSDPPREFGQSHLLSGAVSSTDMLFFPGDTQAHSFPSDDKEVGKLQDGVLEDVLKRFDAADVVWANGNNDGPHYAIFKKQDAETKAYANVLVKRGIVTDNLGILYSGSGMSADALRSSSSLSQMAMFRQTGFYCKALPRLGDTAYAIVYNTILGGSNKVQEAALAETLAWILTKHGDAGIVYVLGHQPSIMKSGTGFVPSKYKHIIKGVFAGHVHKSASTTSGLFTQVPAVTQAAGESDGEFFIARGISANSPEIHLSTGKDLCKYKDSRGNAINADKWVCQSSPSPAPTPSPSPPPSPQPSPVPPTPTPAPMPAGDDTLGPDESLLPDDSLVSKSGNAELKMQATDGNLVLYDSSQHALWSSKTTGHAGARLIFQKSDGNLVLRDGKKALWASKPQKGAVKVQLWDNCDLVILDAAGKKLWSLGTQCKSETFAV